MQESEKVKLPSGTFISVFTLPYFIATKIEAYCNRGGNDIRFSHDIEDVIIVLDGQNDFRKFDNIQGSVKKYLQSKFISFFDDDFFLETVTSFLRQGGVKRVERILDFFKEFSG